MSRLADLIAQLCPDGVEYKPLSECVVLPLIPRGLKRGQYESSGSYPIVDQGRGQIAGYFSEETKLVKDIPGIVFGDHTREIKYVDHFFVPGADGVKWIRAVDDVDIRYLFHSLSSLAIPSRGYNRHWNVAREMSIPVPPVEVQREIVRILDQFTTLEAELEAELEARRTQYEHYRNDLLSYESLAAHGPVEMVKLGDVVEMRRGSGMPKTSFVSSGIPALHYGHIFTKYSVSTSVAAACVSRDDANKLATVMPGDLVLANTSENLDDVGKAVVWKGGEAAVAGGHATVISSELLDMTFLSHYVRSSHFSKSKRKFAQGTKVIELSAVNLAKIPMVLPELSEQRRIADLLDRFDVIVNDISSGLPAEIAARRAQYEHYRERLLSFPEKLAD